MRPEETGIFLNAESEITLQKLRQNKAMFRKIKTEHLSSTNLPYENSKKGFSNWTELMPDENWDLWERMKSTGSDRFVSKYKKYTVFSLNFL